MCPVRIGNPISSFFQLPIDPTNPWAISFPGVEHPYSINLDCTPSKKLINSEYGGRFSVYLPGIDFSVSAMRTWNKMPCFAGSVSQDGSLVFNGVYDRMTMLGADLARYRWANSWFAVNLLNTLERFKPRLKLRRIHRRKIPLTS